MAVLYLSSLVSVLFVMTYGANLGILEEIASDVRKIEHQGYGIQPIRNQLVELKALMHKVFSAVNNIRPWFKALSCPDDFDLVDGTCFKLYDKGKKNWGDALLFCQELGATLAEPRTAVQNDFLYSWIKSIKINTDNNPNVQFYLHLGGSGRDGSYKWASGGDLESGFTKWAYNQPGQDEMRQCLRMGDPHDKWFSGSCKREHYFGCQAAATDNSLAE